MLLTYTLKKGSIPVRFVAGSLSRFSGSELLISYGETKPLPRRKVVLLLRKVVATAKQNQIKSLSLSWDDIRALAQEASAVPAIPNLTDEALGEVAAIAFLMAEYEFITYKTPPKDGFASVETIALVGAPKEAQKGLARGQTVGTGVNDCRELCNTPGGDMTPKTLAAAAKKAIAGTAATCTVLGQKEMAKLGMGALLGMARGSSHEPQFIVLEYWGAAKTKKPLVLVGKGVTFDTGGLNLKPGDHMYEMHLDMSGGAAVIHTLALAAKLKLKTNLVALVPAIENAPASGATRPGDILRSLSGKTIEVVNTDAEGRVILADAITYAKRYNPAAVVDVATLTGAALTALGSQASAVMTNEQDMTVADFMHLAETSGDYLWPMPLWEEYEEMVKGDFADIPNIPTSGNSRYGGVIAGGMFLWQFAKELGCQWAHIDMAPRMTAASNEYLAKGAAGAPVRLLLALAESYANSTAR